MIGIRDDEKWSVPLRPMWRRWCGLVLAHAFHLLVLLLPTLVAAGDAIRWWSIGCFALGIVSAAVLEGFFVSQDGPVHGVRVHDRMALRVAQCVGVCLLVLFWMAQIESQARGEAFLLVQVAGGLLLAIGIMLRIQAIRTLKFRFVSDIQVDQITRDGIYAWLRHPSEIGLLLIAIGAPLLIGAPLTAGAAALCLLPASSWRMHRENIALAKVGS